MVKIFDYIFLMRPTLWVPVWVFYLAGFYRGGGNAQWLPSASLGTAFVLYTILMSGIYVLNQIIDIESDRINKKLFLLPEGYVKVSHAWIEVLVLFALAWILAIPFSKEFKIILLLSMVFGILYSVPPFKLKGRPIFDLFSNSLGYGVIAFSLGWVTTAPFSGLTLIYSLPYFFAMGAVFINTTIPDIEGDKKAGEITTGVLLGPCRASIVSAIFIFIALVLSVLLGDWLCGIASLGALPFFIRVAMLRLLRRSAPRNDSCRACILSIKIGILAIVVLVSIKFLWLIPLIILLFFAMRLYYKHRFNIIYPRFNGI